VDRNSAVIMEPSKTTTNPIPSRELSPRAESSSSVEGSTPDISRDAKELATDVVDRAKDLATEQVSQQREKSAGEIGKLARALHHTSEELGDTMAAPYVERAADMLDRLSGSVRDASLGNAVRATERFARREPLLFLGGAFLLGVLASRFLKSSERRGSGRSESSELEDQDFTRIRGM